MSDKGDTKPGQSVIGRLEAGIERFQRELLPGRKELFAGLADHQEPHTLLITCADSRIVPELITQTDPGELFICRNIGNVVPAYGEMLGGVSAVVEYACLALQVSDIIVCGHSDCGAMKAMLTRDDPKLDSMPTVKSWLRNSEAARTVVDMRFPDMEGPDRLKELVEQNVRTQLQHLKTHPSVAARLAGGTLSLHGWVYNIEDGQVKSAEGDGGEFKVIGAEAREAALKE